MTSSVHYTLTASFSYLSDEDESIVEFLDAAADEMEQLGIEDLMIIADEEAKTFTVSQLVPSHEEESIETVVGKGMGILRTAFHACHASTKDWPNVRQALLSVQVMPAAVDDPPAKASEAKALAGV